MQLCARIALRIVEVKLEEVHADGAPGDVLGIHFAPLAIPDARALVALGSSLDQEEQEEEERGLCELGHAVNKFYMGND